MSHSAKVSLPGPLFVYGAYGKTGSMIAKVAIERGHDVMVSGLDRDRLRRVCAGLGVPGEAVRPHEEVALRRLILGGASVINVAGPFATTFRPMLQACAAEGVPYLDN